MVDLSKMLALMSLVILCSQASAQRYLRSAVPLNDINIDVKAEDNSRHGHAGGEEAERLKRHAVPLNAISIGVNAVDNSKHGAGHGRQGPGGHESGHVDQPEPEVPDSEVAERLKRQAPRLEDINIGINATDNSKHGGGGRKGGPKIPLGPGPVHPSSPNGGSSNEGPADPDVPEIPAGDENLAVIGAIGQNGDGRWPAESQSEGQRLKRQVTRLDDINIKVDAVDNSHHGSDGEEAERLKRQVDPLNAINIGLHAVDNSKHSGGHGHGSQSAGGHQDGHDGTDEAGHEEPEGEQAERLKRQADPLNAINIGVNAVDNSKHGAGHGQHGAGGHQPSGSVEQPEPEVPAGEEAERLKRQAVPLNAINIGINATDNSKHGGGRKGGPKVRPGPGPAVPSNPAGGAGDEEPAGPALPEQPAEPSAPEGPAGDDAPGAPDANEGNGGGQWQEQSQSQSEGRLKRQATPLSDINIDVKAEDNSRHGHAGGEEAERLKRQSDPLNAINIGVNAVDNSKHGAEHGHGSHGAGGHGPSGHDEQPEPEALEGEEAERLKRQASRLEDINVNVNAVDNSKNGAEATSHGGHAGNEPESEEFERLKRQAPRLDDINIDVKAVDNSHHGANGGHASGEEAERLKRQVDPLNAINIGVNAVDNAKHGAGHGPHGAGGHQPSGPVDEPQPEVPSSEEAERLKRQAPVRLDDISVNVNAVDNSHHGSGAGHGGVAGRPEEPEGEEAGRLTRRG